MTLVRVFTDVGGLKPVHLVAKIFEIRDSIFVVRYLSPTDERRHGKVIYRYEDETYEIGDESISKYMDTSDEEDIGFKRIDNETYVLDSDSDSEYDPDKDGSDDESDDSEESDSECSDVPTEDLSDDGYWSEN